MWDALKRGQRAVWIYALSKIKRWTLIILSFPGIWGSTRTGSTSQKMMFLPSSLIGIFCQEDVGTWVRCPPLFIKGLLTRVSRSPNYALRFGYTGEPFHIFPMETTPVFTQAYIPACLPYLTFFESSAAVWIQAWLAGQYSGFAKGDSSPHGLFST